MSERSIWLEWFEERKKTSSRSNRNIAVREDSRVPIYTKRGDRGETGLPGQRRLPKTDLIFDFLGVLDQTNALIGLAVSLIDRQEERELVAFLERRQSDLLLIGSIVAADSVGENPVSSILFGRTAELEAQINNWDSQLPPLKNFILPGGSQVASTIHLARVSVRQTERDFHRLSVKTNLDSIAMFLNRFSDYLFQCARYLNWRAGKSDLIWKKDRNLS